MDFTATSKALSEAGCGGYTCKPSTQRPGQENSRTGWATWQSPISEERRACFPGCHVFLDTLPESQPFDLPHILMEPSVSFFSCHSPESCDKFIPRGQNLSPVLVASESGYFSKKQWSPCALELVGLYHRYWYQPQHRTSENVSTHCKYPPVGYSTGKHLQPLNSNVHLPHKNN